MAKDPFPSGGSGLSEIFCGPCPELAGAHRMICIVNPSPSRVFFVEGPVDVIGPLSVDVAIEDRESGHSLDRL